MYEHETPPPRKAPKAPAERELHEMGGIVGRASITDCVRTMQSKWFQGDYGFVLASPAPLPLRPLRGMLGFFPVEPEPAR